MEDRFIGLMVEDKPALVVGLLAILKSGNAFVPLNPVFPDERIHYIVNDCNIKVLVTDDVHFPRAQQMARESNVLRHVLCIDGSTGELTAKQSFEDNLPMNESTARETVSTVSAPPCYVIYTSGSTGRPKGVPITHRNLVPLLQWFCDYFQLGEQTRIMHNLSYTFDFGVFEILTTVISGGIMYMLDKKAVGDFRFYAEFIESNQINTIHTTPAFFGSIVSIGKRMPSLEIVHLGGENLTGGMVARISELVSRTCRIYNGYGPTEATINCSIHLVVPGQTEGIAQYESIPIGKPSAFNRIYILDKYLRLQPIGVAGELCVAGEGLSAGYLNRPELTADRFNRSYGSYKTYIFYKTGDLARWQDDSPLAGGAAKGIIEFLGRIDQQVKIRGYRIELGEIENCLLKSNTIKEAVVIDRQDEGRSQRYLCAYIIPREGAAGENVTVSELREFLLSELPEYMIPAYFIKLDKIPLTANGKIDRRALPRPTQDTMMPGVGYTAPASETEQKLARIWQEILGIERIGREDDFFESGGDSILATQCIARVREVFQSEISLRKMFERPTIKALAKEVVSHGQGTLAIKKVPRNCRIPLSFSQERLWFLQELDAGNAAYFVPRVIRIKGDLDVTLMERTFTEMIRRHEILRTVFVTKNGEVEQQILQPFYFCIPVMDLSGFEKEDQEQRVSRFIDEEGRLPFDFQRGPLLRVSLLKLKESEHLFVLTEHHLIHDGWTQGVLLNEFITIFTAYAEGREHGLPELPIQYADYAVWQRNLLKGDLLEQHLAYWKEKLSGLPPVLELPVDRPRPAIISGNGDLRVLTIPPSLTLSLKQFSKEQGATLFMTMLAVFKVFLYRYTGIEDLCVGIGIANRRLEEMEGMLGMVINTLPLRTQAAGEISFKRYLQLVKSTCLGAYQHEDTPFGKIVEMMRPERSLSYSPLFQVLFTFMDTPGGELSLPGLELELLPTHNRSAKFDINVVVVPPPENEGEESGEILVEWEYNTDIFDLPTAERMVSHYRRLLEEGLNQPETSITTLPMLSDTEMRQVLYEFNNTEAVYPQEKTIHQLFEEQVEGTPDRIAVVGHGQTRTGTDKNMFISYRQLNQQSDHLAAVLIEKGVHADSIVGMMMDRSVELISGILGILKAGGAYMPIDPAYPEDRINYMLKDSNAKLLLGMEEYQKKIIVICQLLIVNCKLKNVLSQQSPYHHSSFINHHSNQLAYIIYTSGTTGNPKGSLIEHRNVVRLLFNDKFQFDFTERDIWTIFHSFCFDFSVWEMYGALLRGGKAIIIPKMTARDTGEFLGLLARETVTILNQTPSAFYNLINEALNHSRVGKKLYLRYVIFGGEALTPLKLKDWQESYPKTKLINMFGITETTVHVTYKEIRNKDIELNISNIGKPIPTLGINILDRFLKPVPVGVPGEICVGGKGVGRGYLNRVELTTGKFIENPYQQGDRLYRSGDTGRFFENGEMEYLGRIDHQVKIRGFRIELEEIRSQLLKYEEIKDVLVIAGETAGEKYLCAYIVSDAEPSATELRRYLSGKLPDYMIPYYFVRLERIPLTSNGKVDRNALPDVHENREIEQEYASPLSETEKKLAEIWEDILGVNVGIHMEFFHCGGDSIKAVRLINLINTQFSAHLKIADIYLNGTIKKLAAVIEREKIAKGYANDELERALTEIEELKNRVMADERLSEEIEDVYPMSDIQKGMVFHSLKDTQSALYHDQMVYQATISEFNAALFKKAFLLNVEKHAILRTVFDLDTYSEPVQLVYRCVPNDISHDDISSLKKESQEAYLTRFLEEDRENAFQFGIPPLWRLRTFALGSDNICVVLVAHHAILDGWSVASLVTETINTYWQLKANPDFVPVMLKNSYKAFINEQMVEKNRDDIVDFWRRELDGFKRLEFSNPQLDNANAGKNLIKKYNYNLGVDLLAKLKETSKVYRTNIKHLCFAAYLYMLNMDCYENEMVVGLVTNNRPVCQDGDKILGCFLNTIPVRLTIPTQVSWLAYLDLVEDKLLELKPYERLPLFDIVRAIGENTQDRNPIFDAIFNFVDFHVLGQIQQEYGKDDTGKLNVEGNIITNTLFNFNVSTTLENFGVFISYSESLLSEEAVEKLCRYFNGVLNKFIDEPRGSANKVELIPIEERKKLLEEFNDTNTEYPVNKTVHELFAEQVERIPDRIALVGQGAFLKNRPLVDPQKTFNYLSYRQLHEQSNQLACLLIEKGVLADNIVGIMMERSIEMMVGIYGILKSGGAYLPIDPSYPQERIQFMLEDSNARVLLVMEGCQNKLIVNCQLLIVNCKLKNVRSLQPPSHYSSSISNHSNQLAYIIYTSGSTGRPKGVMIEHRSVVNLLFALQNEYPFSSADTYLLKTSYIFDVSVTELFGWVVGGGRLAILERGGEKDPDVIFDWIERSLVTHINFVPSMFNEFIVHADAENRNRLSSLKYIFLAGEVLLPQVVKRFRALEIPAQLENIYGPTESTVYASKYSLSGWDGNGSIPIGKPLPNLSLYIINKGCQWQSLGAAGELCIAGVGLARGYLNNPELTKQKFLEVQEPFFKKVPGLFYRTGDLARWLSDGNIEFLGRIDHQVKIRGYRIELDEIENHLSKYNGIKEAVVVVKEADSGDKNLAAYIVSDIEVSTEALRDYLANLLPGYMIPAYFVPLEKMPLTPSGKIDRIALPEPELIIGKEYEGPRNEIEKKLVELWSEILVRNPLHMTQLQTSIGINDNFFLLGGHSLKATSLVSRIYKVFGVKIPLGEIFKRPTIKGLFDYLERAEREQYIWIVPTEIKEYYELSPAQKSLFTLQQLHQDNTFYNMPSIIRLERDLDKEKLQEVFQQIIKRHESLRTSFEIVNEIPVQRIQKELLFELEYIELAKDRVGDRSAIENIIGSVIRPFDLSRPPLFRVCLITAADLRLLVVDMHHIISDGISNMVLEKEFQVLCDGKELPPLRLQYKDYVGWRNGKDWQLKLRQQEMYWLSEFLPEPPVLNLPMNYPRPVEKTFEGNTAGIALLAQEFLLLKEIAGETGATMFVVVLWLFAILMSRLSGQDDIVIGVPVSGRPHSDLECLIGVFINTIPLRLSIDDTQSVLEFLTGVKQKCLRAFENQDYPFEELVEKVAPERDINRNPLFDVLLNYMNHTETLASVWDHFSEEQYTYQGVSSKFDFSVDVHQYRDSMYLRFEYSTQLFKAETIDRFLECFRQIILSISNNREIKLEEIEISHDFGELETNVFSAAPMDFNSMFSRETEKINNNRSLK